ncbi:MAG TPA: RcpC/CpaB family pilus assembly protein [Jatrophihabitantaceae bacterium]|nr:RcpC/CpaB family pilus assembly protein [Jatrophihabitantaceae bacterium]
MFGFSTARLAWLGRWPRRAAALGCLLLAFASAVSSRHGPRAGASGPANPLLARLRDGQVAASVALSDAGAAGFLRAGDRVDLYATPGSSGDPPTCAAVGRTPLGSGLRVLAVDGPSGGLGGDGTSRLVVAMARGAAVQLATLQSCGMFAVLDKDP